MTGARTIKNEISTLSVDPQNVTFWKATRMLQELAPEVLLSLKNDFVTVAASANKA